MKRAVFVGGPTAIGKSIFVDAVIGIGDVFRRPTAYTTRPPRADERPGDFIFVSVDTFWALRDTGALLAVEEAYGNYYAFSRDSFDQLWQEGIIPIREVHPSNHAKLKQLIADSLSVLLLPRYPDQFWPDLLRDRSKFSSDRIARIEADREYYGSLHSQLPPFDITMLVERSNPPHELRLMLLRALHLSADVEARSS